MGTLFLFIATVEFIILAMIAGIMTVLFMIENIYLVERLEKKLKILAIIAMGLFTIMLLLSAVFGMIEILSDTPVEWW